MGSGWGQLLKSEMDAERPMKRPPIRRKLELGGCYREGMESICMQQWNYQPLVWALSEGAKGDLWASVLHGWMDDHVIEFGGQEEDQLWERQL